MAETCLYLTVKMRHTLLGVYKGDRVGYSELYTIEQKKHHIWTLNLTLSFPVRHCQGCMRPEKYEAFWYIVVVWSHFPAHHGVGYDGVRDSYIYCDELGWWGWVWEGFDPYLVGKPLRWICRDLSWNAAPSRLRWNRHQRGFERLFDGCWCKKWDSPAFQALWPVIRQNGMMSNVQAWSIEKDLSNRFLPFLAS